MKVLAIGGSGGMGRFAVNATQKLPGVTNIIVADLSAAGAEDFARTCAPHVTAMGLDVTDGKALDEAMSDVDVVMNTSGPFFKLAVPILQAAINNKCHYLDICDDWEPTEELLAMDAAAKKAGISATVGLGASPGVTNMLGLLALRELDQVNKMITGWDMSGAQPENESSQTGTNAAMLHGIEQMTGTVKIRRNSTFQLVKPLQKIRVDFPGIRPFDAALFGHPEAITFPHHYPELEESMNVAHGEDATSFLLRSVMQLVDWKIISKTKAAAVLSWIEAKAQYDQQRPVEERAPSAYGLASGMKDRQPARVGSHIDFESLLTPEQDLADLGMGAFTGIPLYCGVKLLLEGKISQPGVFAPEGGHIQPEDFFQELFAELSVIIGCDASVLHDALKVNRSWDC